jgi:hypothetical protein
MDLAQQLKDHLESPLDGFIKEQRDLRKVVKEMVTIKPCQVKY